MKSNDVYVYSKDKANTLYFVEGDIIPNWNNGNPIDRKETKKEFIERVNCEINDLMIQEEKGYIKIKTIQWFDKVYSDDTNELSCIITYIDNE